MVNQNVQTLLNATILNFMIIFRKNSPQTKTDHLKFRLDLVQTLLFEHVSGVERKVPGCHCTDKTVPCLTERDFPDRIPPSEWKAKTTKRPVAGTNKAREGIQYFSVLTVKLVFVSEGCFKAYQTKFYLEGKICYMF
jgi:hypothetical protein